MVQETQNNFQKVGGKKFFVNVLNSRGGKVRKVLFFKIH